MIVINDVGPRDGLQSQAKLLGVAQRVELINAIAEAQVPSVEVGAFVSPKAVPAMQGTDEVFQSVSELAAINKMVLIPNQRGYEMAKSSGVKNVSMVLYATEQMSEKNVNMPIAQVDQNTLAILQQAKQDGIKVSAYIAVAFGCPFAGDVEVDHVQALVERYFAMGLDELILADTIGAANPAQVSQMFKPLIKEFGDHRLAAHFHDTRAMGLANVFAASQQGVSRFDASIAGLGGCPFAPGASGNVATEDVVMMLEQMGFDTGIDMHKLLAASRLAIELTGTAKGGRAKPWLDRAYIN